MVCCTSPAAICQWFAVSLFCLGIAEPRRRVLGPFRASAAATILLAAAVGWLPTDFAIARCTAVSLLRYSW